MRTSTGHTRDLGQSWLLAQVSAHLHGFSRLWFSLYSAGNAYGEEDLEEIQILRFGRFRNQFRGEATQPNLNLSLLSNPFRGAPTPKHYDQVDTMAYLTRISHSQDQFNGRTMYVVAQYDLLIHLHTGDPSLVDNSPVSTPSQPHCKPESSS